MGARDGWCCGDNRAALEHVFDGKARRAVSARDPYKFLRHF